MTNKVVMIDGNSLLFRAFYALPLLHNNKGVYTNAVYGFSNILLKILEEEKPTHMLVAFDAGKTTFRHSSYKDYKGGRQKTPPELSEQFPLVKEVLQAFNIPHYELDLYEADDIIGTLSTEADKKNWDVKIISGDQDLLQLVTNHVTVDLTRKGISEVNSYTPTTLLEEMELEPRQIIELKALMGDNSDNIPGVPGVGIKTATKLLKQFKTVDNLYANLNEVTAKKLKEKLTDNEEAARMSHELVTIKTDSPVKMTLEDMTYEGYEYKDIYTLFSELEFNSLLNRLSGNGEEIEETTFDELPFEVLKEVREDIFTGNDALLVEMLDDNYHYSPVEAIVISNETGNYVMTKETAIKSPIFKDWVSDAKQKKIVFDAKAVTVALLQDALHLKGVSFDLMLAAYLINPAEKNEEITSIAKRSGITQIYHNEEVYGKGAKKAIPNDFAVLADHTARKASALYDLKDTFEQQLEDNDMSSLFRELELPLAQILAEMEHTGVLVDTERLKDMGQDLKKRIEDIESEVHSLAGEKFNVNSPKQLAHILFEKLELPVIKKTKTGYSTAADVLEKLEPEHEIIPKLLMYRQLKKLDSTYVDGLLKVVDKESHKVHTRFNQALTQTGRLSSTEPNLQNIPIRLEEGRKIRHVFVPSHEDWLIFSADYSQIELRVLAHISGDKRLLEAFHENKDIHTQTAMDVFHVSEQEVDDNMRRQAKAVNFGIVYGISDYGLSQNLQIPRKEAKAFIDKYFEIYPDVKTYMEEIVQKAKHDGYVSTLMKRRRYLPEISSRNFNQRSFAERTAMNTPIQGTAADIIKKAMIDVHHRLINEGLEATMLMQVHDELIFEAPQTELEKLKEIIPDVMENTVKLDVPLKVDKAFGNSWYDAD